MTGCPRPLHGLTRLVIAGALGGACAVPTAAQSSHSDPARPSLRIGVLASSIRLDGRLDEPDWRRADSIANLTQVEPVQRGVPSARTVVRVLTTGDAIIFGIWAHDPDPDRIVSFARERDAPVNSEDHIKIVLDTYLDGRPRTSSRSTPTARATTRWWEAATRGKTPTGTPSGRRPQHARPVAGRPKS